MKLIATFEHPEHNTIVTLTYVTLAEPIALCQCGARWSYSRTKTEDEMRSVWESHLAYFTRPATQVL